MPMLSEIEQIRTPQDLARAFAQSGRNGGGAPFGFWVDADAKAPDSYAVYLYQAGLGLPDRITTSRRMPPARRCARNTNSTSPPCWPASARRMRGQGQTHPGPREQTRPDQWDNVTLRDREKNYNKGPQSELKRLTPAIDWNAYLTQAGLAGQSSLIIGQPTYLAALNEVMQQTPVGDWQAYLKWHLITDYAPTSTARPMPRTSPSSALP